MGMVFRRTVEILDGRVIVPPINPSVPDAEVEFGNPWFNLDRIYGVIESIHVDSIQPVLVSSLCSLGAHFSFPPFQVELNHPTRMKKP